MSKSQLPAKVIAPLKGSAGVLGVPITVTCGPPTSVAPASGVATSTHASAAVTMASPLDVLTSALVDCCAGRADARLAAEGDLDRQRRFVVLVKLSSQRPQFALRLM